MIDLFWKVYGLTIGVDEKAAEEFVAAANAFRMQKQGRSRAQYFASVLRNIWYQNDELKLMIFRKGSWSCFRAGRINPA